MSGIARILLARGVPVSGSDRRDTPTLLALRALGARVEVGHDPAHLGDADTVVVSTAIRPDNPELATARERGLRVLPRAVALASVMAGRRSIAVAGTHGKTSTTSMLTVAVQACGVDPSFAIGGDLNESGSNAHAGEGDVFVAEADESDRSFLLLAPFGAIVTNVEADHLDNYGDLAAVEAAFDRFLETVDPTGLRRRLRRRPRRRPAAHACDCAARLRTYGRARRTPTCGCSTSTSPPTAPATPRSSTARSSAGSASSCPASTWRSTAPPRCSPASSWGCRPRGSSRGWPASAASTAGSSSRASPAGVRVYDDYAHHPTEVSAQLRGGPGGRRRRPAGGGLPAAPLQPHPGVRRGLRRGARAWPTRSWSWTSTAPARTRCPA